MRPRLDRRARLLSRGTRAAGGLAVALSLAHPALAAGASPEQAAFGIQSLHAAVSPARPGAGLVAAVIDEGCDASHRALRGRIAVFRDFVTPTNHRPLDAHGHGTAVAGLIASADAPHPGVAPAAQIACLRVADPFLRERSDRPLRRRIRAALRWVLANRARYGIRVVNMSLGARTDRCGARSPFTSELDRLSRAGVIVTIAAGNSGDRAGCGLNPWAAASSALSVGSIERPDDRRLGFVASAFSGRGPERPPGARYGPLDSPSLMAPGDRVRVADIFSGGYMSDSGTSFSAPFVAGVALLLEQLAPAATPAQVRAALLSSTHDLGRPGRDRVYGAGAIDPLGAAALLRPDLRGTLGRVAFPAERHCEWRGLRGRRLSLKLPLTASGGPFFAAVEPAVLRRPRRALQLFGRTRVELTDRPGHRVSLRLPRDAGAGYPIGGFGLAYATNGGTPLAAGAYVLRVRVDNALRQRAFDVAVDVAGAAPQSRRCN